MDKKTWIIASVSAITAGGCGHGPRSVTDPDPADKIPAIEVAVQRNDRRAIPELVKSLDSDDSAIRFYAIDGSRALTKEDFGYRFYDDAEARKPAVEKWQKWLAEQHHP